MLALDTYHAQNSHNDLYHRRGKVQRFLLIAPGEDKARIWVADRSHNWSGLSEKMEVRRLKATRMKVIIIPNIMCLLHTDTFDMREHSGVEWRLSAITCTSSKRSMT